MSALHTVSRQQLRVLVGDLKVAQGPDASIITFALGSCVGLFAWHPHTLQGGCLHYKLPVHPEGDTSNPYKYGDLGIPTLIRALATDKRDARNLRLIACGGAAMGSGSDTRRVGKRNIAIMKKFLWKHGLVLLSEDLGGDIARTAELNLANGTVTVQARNTLTTL
ncbi:MAG: chemotaxis protein CheD [Myxococcota bacterium]